MSVMRSRWRLIAVVLGAVALGGCQSDFQAYYIPQTPGQQFAPIQASAVRVYRLGARNLEQVRKRLYPKATIVGESQFYSVGEDVEELRKFAASIGADVALWQEVWVGMTLEDDTGFGWRGRLRYYWYPNDQYREDVLYLRTQGK